MLDWLNNNPGGTAIISSAIGALMGAFFTFVGWLGGKRAGKKAAQKELEPLRLEIHQLQTTVTQQAEKIANITAQRIDTFNM